MTKPIEDLVMDELTSSAPPRDMTGLVSAVSRRIPCSSPVPGDSPQLDIEHKLNEEQITSIARRMWDLVVFGAVTPIGPPHNYSIGNFVVNPEKLAQFEPEA